MLSVEPVLAHLDRDFDQAVERLCDLLRIRSVSTDPAYKDDTRQAAQWLADQLAGMGFEASLRETLGHPMVVAHHPGAHSAPEHRAPRGRTCSTTATTMFSRPSRWSFGTARRSSRPSSMPSMESASSRAGPWTTRVR